MIPTGSMAPTLMGRHKEVTCPECGLVYAINASDDTEQNLVDKRANAARRLDEVKKAPERLASVEAMKVRADRSGDPVQREAANDLLEKTRSDAQNAPSRIAELTRDLEQLHEIGLCVNCRSRTDRRRRPELQGGPHPGDEVPLRAARSSPARPARGGGTWSSSTTPRSPRPTTSSGWSACPARNSGSTTAIIQTRPEGSNAPFQIQRKPLIHQQAMQMLVYDDAHRPKSLEGKPEWRRWEPSGAWKEEPGRHLRGQRRRRRGLVGAALSPPPPRPRAVGRPREEGPAPQSPSTDADHRLLLVQHQHQHQCLFRLGPQL